MEEPTRLVMDDCKSSSKFLTIFDDLLPPKWCQRVYDYSLKKGKPWGVYIPTDDVLDERIDPELLFQNDPERAIALIATRELIFNRGKGFVAGDIGKIAGTAIWCLSSGVTNQVEYHIDYAELYRYETNVIYPPLYGATCHVSPFREGDMVGGDFQVNLGGLEHYKRFGYKGRLSSPEAFAADLRQGADWVTVRYKCNRGILYDGSLPHLSTPVVALPTGDDDAAADSGAAAPRAARRVILGFNCFPQEVDECCRRAPEHSDAFNRTVKLYQKIASLSSACDKAAAPEGQATSSSFPGASRSSSGNDSSSSTSSSGSSSGSSSSSNGGHAAGDAAPPPAPAAPRPRPAGAITANDLAKNPALARLLVLAARNMRKRQEHVTQVEGTASDANIT
jgi:hypothetical protein